MTKTTHSHVSINTEKERERMERMVELSGVCLFFTCLRRNNIYLVVLWFRIYVLHSIEHGNDM